MALGDAFITIHADVSKFKTELAAALKGPLAEAEKTAAATRASAATQVAAQDAVAKSAEQSAAAQAAASAKATAAVEKQTRAEEQLRRAQSSSLTAAPSVGPVQGPAGGRARFEQEAARATAAVEREAAKQAAIAERLAVKQAAEAAKAAAATEKEAARATSAAERDATRIADAARRLADRQAAEAARATAAIEREAAKQAAAAERAAERAAVAAERAAAREIAAQERAAVAAQRAADRAAAAAEREAARQLAIQDRAQAAIQRQRESLAADEDRAQQRAVANALKTAAAQEKTLGFTPSTTGFGASVRAITARAAAARDSITVPIRADDSLFKFVVDRAKAAKAELAKKLTIPVDADTGPAIAKLAQLQALSKSVVSDVGKVGLSKLSDLGGSAISTSISAITTAAKFATVGVLGLGAALAGIGLAAGAQLQQAKISFRALAPEIAGAAEGTRAFAKAQGDAVAIGDKFTQQLRQIALESALTFSSLTSTSQQLLSLGFSGKQTQGILLTVGNALAASGKSGAGLNDDLRGIIVAFSQIKGAGRLLAQDLNQITTRIPSATRTKVYANLAVDLKKAELAAKAAGQPFDQAATGITKLVGANGKLDPKNIKAVSIAVQKLAKTGGVDADVAIRSILKTLQEVPGASKDAITGLNALQRQNKTLAGQFEQFKETVRNSLADVFNEQLSDKLATQIQGFTKNIQESIKTAGPALQGFVLNTVDILGKLIGPLSNAIVGVFGALNTVLSALGPKLPGIVNGFTAVFTAIQGIATGEAGKRIGETFNAIGDAIRETGKQLQAEAPLFRVLAAAALDLIDIALTLAPVLKGVGDVLGVIGIILTPLVPVLDAIKAAFDFLPPGFGEALGIVAGALAAMVIALVAVPAAALAASGAVLILSGAVDVLAVALATIGWTEVIAILAAVGLAIGALATQFDSFRNVVVEALFLTVKATTESFGIILFGIEAVLHSFGEAGHSLNFLGKLNPFKSVADSAEAGATKVKGFRDSLNQSADSILKWKSAADRASATISGTASNIAIFNSQLGLTGKNALSAAADATELNAAIAALPDEKRIAIRVAIEESITQSNTAFFAAHPEKGNINKLGEGGGFDLDAFNAAAAAAKKKATDVSSDLLNSLRNTFGGGNTGGSAPGGGGGASAATKAKNAFADRIRTILQGLNKEFKTGLIEGDAKNVRKTLNKLAASIIDAFADNKKAQPTKLLAQLQRESTRLQRLVQQRIDLVNRLKLAEDASNKAIADVASFANITSAFDELSKAIDGTTGSLADLSRLKIIKPGQDTLGIAGTLGTAATAAQVNGAKLDEILKARLKAIQDFQADLATIIKRGVNRNLVQQIVDAGVSGGAATADALANASNATIASINATQKQIDAAAKALGSTAGDVAASVGENVVLGIVNGLKKQKGELTAAITDLVDTIVKRLRKGLGVKSPSTVTAWIGKMAGKGLVNALIAHLPHVAAAAARMASAAVPDIPRVNVDPIGDALAKARFAPVSVDALLRVANSDALEGLQASLAAAQAPPVPQVVPAPVGRQDAFVGLTPSQAQKAFESALANQGLHGGTKEIHAPVTQHITVPHADPHLVARALTTAARKAG